MTELPPTAPGSTWWSSPRPDPEPGAGGRARSRTLGTGIVTSVVCRAASALGPLALVAIALGYLGKDLYGVWMTVVAVTGMALWADFGLGNGLMTRLAASHSRRDVGAARRHVSTAYAILSAGALAGLVGLWATAGVVPWAGLVAADTGPAADSAAAVGVICLTAFAVNVPLALIQRVQFAAQRVSVSNMWQAAGSLTALGLAGIAVVVGAGPLVVIAAASAGPPLVNLINNLYTFAGPCRDIAPRPSSVQLRQAGELLGLGGQFFVISICSSISLNIDNIVVAHTLGSEAVSEYSVIARVFLTLGTVITIINMPFWPTAGDAIEQDDREWLRSTTRRMILLSVCVVAGLALAMLMFGPLAIEIWTSGQVVADLPMLIGWSVWWLLLAAASPLFMVQNAAGVLGPQIVGWCLFLVLSVPAKWIAGQNLGVTAVVWAGVVVYLVVMWPAAVIGYRRTRALNLARSTHMRKADAELQG